MCHNTDDRKSSSHTLIRCRCSDSQRQQCSPTQRTEAKRAIGSRHMGGTTTYPDWAGNGREKEQNQEDRRAHVAERSQTRTEAAAWPPDVATVLGRSVNTISTCTVCWTTPRTHRFGYPSPSQRAAVVILTLRPRTPCLLLVKAQLGGPDLLCCALLNHVFYFLLFVSTFVFVISFVICAVDRPLLRRRIVCI